MNWKLASQHIRRGMSAPPDFQTVFLKQLESLQETQDTKRYTSSTNSMN